MYTYIIYKVHISLEWVLNPPRQIFVNGIRRVSAHSARSCCKRTTSAPEA